MNLTRMLPRKTIRLLLVALAAVFLASQALALDDPGGTVDIDCPCEDANGVTHTQSVQCDQSCVGASYSCDCWYIGSLGIYACTPMDVHCQGCAIAN